jgi:hypothetical protein
MFCPPKFICPPFDCGRKKTRLPACRNRVSAASSACATAHDNEVGVRLHRIALLVLNSERIEQLCAAVIADIQHVLRARLQRRRLRVVHDIGREARRRDILRHVVFQVERVQMMRPRP